MITSTLTRPTTINPTSSCDRKIYVVEAVDISQLRRPKPRIITLEPIPRRTKAVTQSKRSSLEGTDPNQTANKDARPTSYRTSSSSSAPRVPEEPLRSPVPSEPSIISAVGSSNRSSKVVSALSRNNAEPESAKTAITRTDKTISATAELQRGGCLPGDAIPVKISIDHAKAIKSVQGIIITFYRLARIDTHPAIPLGPSVKGKTPVYEDFYPKSRTGLGGLSLSSAGSSQVFRMDLSQTFAPLIIDPTTLSTVVKTSIPVPEDIFPTISSVPGNIISFHYYVEVVMDLQGKLAGQDRFLPKISITDAPAPFGYLQNNGHNYGGTRNNNQSNGMEIQDTAQIRRDRSVIACTFEVIVGTRDSQRKNVRKTSDVWDDNATVQRVETSIYDPRKSHEERCFQERRHSYGYRDSGEGVESVLSNSNRNSRIRDSSTHPAFMTPPQLEEPVDEKARIRRAEEQLLPSAPPMEEGESSLPPEAQPSAPPLAALETPYEYSGPSAPAYAYPAATDPMMPSSNASGDHHAGPIEGRIAQQSSRLGGPNDDKQEIERQRLLAAASAPDDDGEEEEGNGASSSSRANLPTPSAPVLTEDHDFEPYDADAFLETPGTSRNHENLESLPQYRK